MKYAITAAVLLLLVPGVIYAEESIVQVPFDYHGQSCWLESATTYQCTWQGEVEPFSLEDLERYAHVLTEEQYAEEYAKLTAEPTVVEFVDDRTPEEKLIEELQLKLYRGEADATEATHLRLLKQLDECHRGLGNSAAIQDQTSFVVSKFTYGKYNNIEISGQVGQLLLAIQECLAQQTLEHYVLSEEYTNKLNGSDDVFYDHYGAWKGIEALDYELYTKNSNRVDMDGICNNNQYDWENRIMMGCEDTREYEGKQNTNPKGYITYFSQAHSEYMQYLNENSRYATSEDKELQADIAQPIVQEMLEKNIWYGKE